MITANLGRRIAAAAGAVLATYLLLIPYEMPVKLRAGHVGPQESGQMAAEPRESDTLALAAARSGSSG